MRIAPFILTVGPALLIASIAAGQDANPVKTEALNHSDPNQLSLKVEGLKPAGGNHVSIPKGSFGKEFLISASVIPQVMSPTSTALTGKVVRFELFQDGVDLYESTSGWVVTDELPSRRLLTTFPVVSQDDGNVVIDFNAGMRRVFSEAWHGASGHFNPAAGTRSLEIPVSRIFEIKNQGDELIVRQSAQARDRQADPNREDRYELRYFVAPYIPGDLLNKENDVRAARYVRFFETYPMLEQKTGRSTAKITLFDIRKPIVIHYSANTPADYEEAVKDGILYWNRAFGKDVVQVEKAPPGVTAPDAHYNIIQWVPWDAAGFAYADLVVDPKTGQSLHGQAYMHSAFAIHGRASARALLRTMRGAEDVKPEPTTKPEKVSEGFLRGTGLAASFLAPARACEIDAVDFARTYAAGLEALLAEEVVDDRATKRISQDYVRAVIAHEVGHILGLRHNFAGSLASTLSHKEINAWFKAYAKDDNAELLADRVSTSSIMEYTTMRASVYAGAKIRKTKDVFPHDKAAIQWGYMNQEEAIDKKMLFGTDQDFKVFGDVLPGDYGTEPVVGAYDAIGQFLRTLPNSVIETFIRAKAPEDRRDAHPLEMVNLRPEIAATQVIRDFGRLLEWFKSGTRSLRVESGFPFVGELNQREVLAAHWKFLNEQVEKLGGVDRAIFSFLPVELKLEIKGEPKDVEVVEKIDAKAFSERLGKLLDGTHYQTFIGLDEKTYSFTKEEKALILARGKVYFEEFEKRVLKGVCALFENARRDLGVKVSENVSDDDIVAKLEKRLIEFSKEVILKRNEEERRRGKVDKAYVEVAEFKYEMETRLAAARLLSDNVGSFRGWSVDAKADLHKQLKEAVDSALNIQNFKEFQESSLSRPLREWYLNQQNILALLPPKKGGPPAGAPGAVGASGPGH